MKRLKMPESVSMMDELLEEIRLELVRKVAAADRDENREIDDALDSE